MVAAALRDLCHIETLWLGGNPLLDSGATAIADALCSNTSLRLIDLEGTGITDEGASALYASLEENGTLAVMDLGCNEIGDRGVMAMVQHALKANRSAAGTVATSTMYERKNQEHMDKIRLEG